MKWIPGYVGKYAAKEDGTLYTFVRWPKGKQMKAKAKRGPYYVVGLSLGSKQYKMYSVHQLILLAFEGPCPEGHQVGHRNGIHTDNRLSNLYYVTSKENHADQVLHGTRAKHDKRKVTTQIAHEIKTSVELTAVLADRYNISTRHVQRIRQGTRWNLAEAKLE